MISLTLLIPKLLRDVYYYECVCFQWVFFFIYYTFLLWVNQ